MDRVQVGEAAPDFSVSVVYPDGTVGEETSTTYRGRWLALVFYPRDFSFVCPTELTAFGDRIADFRERDCALLGVSVDTVETHQRWLTTPAHRGGIADLPFPLASDEGTDFSRAFGVLDCSSQVSQRGLFLIDPDGVLQYAVVHATGVGRNVTETLRVLDALKSGGLCPASWTSADGTLDLENLLDVGRVLDRFRLEEKLGEGSFGTVYAAYDLRLARSVALKILRRVQPGNFQNLLAEARSASRIDHPHVCTVYSLEEIDGLSMIVMQLVAGQPLSKTVRDGMLPSRSADFAKQIAAGIEAAHAVGVIHGDLKPSNILVTPEDKAVIVDFGLANMRRIHQDEQTQQATHSDVEANDAKLASDGADCLSPMTIEMSSSPGIHGTPPYMSPEQARGEILTTASDIFSFGLLLIELLTGERALPKFPITQQLEYLQRPELGNEIASRIDSPNRELLEQMLALSPEERPTAQGVLESLNSLDEA